MRWIVSWFARRREGDLLLPEVCNVLYHVPSSLKEECDCVHFCKWGGGHPGGGEGEITPFQIRTYVEEEEEECVCIRTIGEQRSLPPAFPVSKDSSSPPSPKSSVF